MKAQKTIKISDRVHAEAARVAKRYNLSNSMLIDILVREAASGRSPALNAIGCPEGEYRAPLSVRSCKAREPALA